MEGNRWQWVFGVVLGKITGTVPQSQQRREQTHRRDSTVQAFLQVILLALCALTGPLPQTSRSHIGGSETTWRSPWWRVAAGNVRWPPNHYFCSSNMTISWVQGYQLRKAALGKGQCYTDYQEDTLRDILNPQWTGHPPFTSELATMKKLVIPHALNILVLHWGFVSSPSHT